jgi:hypothetical protein
VQDKEPAVQAVEPELPAESVSVDYITRMRGEISTALRAEGSAGRKADGLFGTVFHIGEIKVLGGNEILFALPRGVFSQVSGEINQVVERVLDSVLGKSVRARFVDLARLAEFVPAQSGPPGSTTGRDPEADVPADPIEEAKSDPVVQDLVRRGGQVTDVELLE